MFLAVRFFLQNSGVDACRLFKQLPPSQAPAALAPRPGRVAEVAALRCADRRGAAPPAAAVHGAHLAARSEPKPSAKSH